MVVVVDICVLGVWDYKGWFFEKVWLKLERRFREKDFFLERVVSEVVLEILRIEFRDYRGLRIGIIIIVLLNKFC